MTTKGTAPAVVLFDIDETLIHSGGAGARSWNAAFETIYGKPADIGQAHLGRRDRSPSGPGDLCRGHGPSAR